MTEMKKMPDGTYDMSFDLLRIFCSFVIVLLHASAHVWYYLDVNGKEWLFANACNAFTRFGVPVFVMISGALFLSSKRAMNLKGFWLRNILRIFIIYVLWCVIYGSVHYFSSSEAFALKPFLKSILAGNYHLWFLPMLLGIYALVPLLRKCVMVSTKNDHRYFLLLFFVFQIVLTTLRLLSDTPEISSFLSGFTVEVACGYVGYFVLGHYLYSVKTYTKLDKVLLYATFPVFYALNVLLSTVLSRKAGEPMQEIIDSFGIFTFFMAIAVFVFFTQTFHGLSQEGKAATVIKTISKSTLGIYLIHLLIMESPWILPMFQKLSPYASIPIVTVLTFVISLILATILRKIPFLGRYVC
ncbi:MAG: acyltransferase family protein [Lachnospiraceae bacterium]|nr:acyltransferase family protein [Lachnospiraceae bacterium]